MNEKSWLNKTKGCLKQDDQITIVTEPKTDFWQRTFYGFQAANAPCFLWSSSDDFSISCRVESNYKQLYDQSGLILFIDDENWCKISTEFETETLSRLGSVVTNGGYSDWATTDIQTRNTMYYKLSRRGPDFLAEQSTDGLVFSQMRVFHMSALGETSRDFGSMNPKSILPAPVSFGVYACSPSESSFTAIFSHIQIDASTWQAPMK